MVQGPPEFCTCLAIRQAARHVTQFYDRHLAPTGLRSTQFSILSKLRTRGPLTVNSLAGFMVMDRTTLGRNIIPLEKAGLIVVAKGEADRRSKTISLTESGHNRLNDAWPYWLQAQQAFDAAYGLEKGAELRDLMRSVTLTPLGTPSR